ncbi:sulfate/molybdate ABC transporter ATP-binding protein [Microvirga sp. 2MCAF38]|uniref:sulfate/molybdate ABC transporter ATP-binding protein n=1 Tax=Microvirga sp. 2MCAF38 TaxID=3232989 RepID=UPI003F9A2278
MEVRVANVAKEFGETAALRDVSLTVHPGELLALLGPSGSGKTTLLRVIAGLEAPERGQVFFGGQDATSLAVQKRQVGFVFQHYALFKHLNVGDNIAYGLRVRERARRPSKADIAQRVSDLLELVQLSGYEARFPAQLSGGQRQRVALARALAVEPRVLLLDEPFGALDAKVRKDLRRWLRDIHERTGQTTIFVTHDQDEALELADRVAVLNNGRLEQIGTPDEVQDRPQTPFVLGFLGDAARFDARIVGRQVLIGGKAVPVDIHGRGDGEAALYSRPWQLRIASPAEAHVRGVVTGIRRVGGSRRIEIQGAAKAKVEVETALSVEPAIGEEVGLEILNGYVFATD